MENSLVSFSNELVSLAKTVDPHVVSIRARRHYPSSGLRRSPDVVVTADHAIHREDDITVTLADGNTIGATLAGRDPGTDLAVLKLRTPAPPPAQLARAQAVKAGELALVVGRSPDSGVNASLGIVSAVSGNWRTWRGGRLDAYVRLDATLFPQSSGAAVVNARGELMGIATSALSRIAGVVIPATTVQSVTEKLLEKGFVPHGYLGIGVQQVPFSDALRQKLAIANRSGLIVLTVEPDGPAEKAGIVIGDILTGINGATVENIDDLRNYSDAAQVGSTTKIAYVRGGAFADVSLTVGERPGRRN